MIKSMCTSLAGPKQFNFKGHNYFYTGDFPELSTKRVDWLEARNLCREYCMDAVSIETQEENNLIFKLIQEKDVPYIWTSGRLCDFNGTKLVEICCLRLDVQRDFSNRLRRPQGLAAKEPQRMVLVS